jgi:hypothetical protein
MCFILGWGACCSVPPLVAGEILPTIGDPQTTRTIAVVDSGAPVSFTGAANTAVANNVTQDDVPTSKKKQTADDPLQNEFGHFMRVRKDAKGKPLALETSVTRYILKNSAGENVVVDLIGVVHVGEQEYYEQLNKQFEQYDGLLYELVAPEGTRIPKGGRGTSDPGNPVAALQLGLKSVLELEFQLDHIDYTKENFIHADMTPEEFAESMERNEESIGKMLLKGIGQSMAMQSSGQSSDAEMLMAMFSNNRTQRMRRLMANQMQQIENGMVMFNGKEGSTIIEHRNAKVMDVLRKELNSGKKHVGIFYGAGHLPDMQRRLTSDFQARRAGQNWLKAWELNAK